MTETSIRFDKMIAMAAKTSPLENRYPNSLSHLCKLLPETGLMFLGLHILGLD